MTSTSTPFAVTIAPCGRSFGGDRLVTEDLAGLVTEDLLYTCGCRSTREEFHDGSVHHMVLDHRGRVLIDEELRGE